MRINISIKKLLLTLIIVCVQNSSFSEPFGYVTTSAGVTVFDTEDNSPVTTIPVSGSPFDIVTTPDGAFAYLSCEGDNTIKQIDLSSNMVVATIPISASPTKIAITPDGCTVLAVSEDVVFRINASNNSVSGQYTTANPSNDTLRAITISPDGATAYVTRLRFGGATYTSHVLPLSVTSLTVGTEINLTPIVGTSAIQYREIGITLDGTKLYITAANSFVVSVTLPNTVNPLINIGGAVASGIAFTPDGTTVYVTKASGSAITPINVSNNMPGADITVGTTPLGIAITTDGTKAFVANFTTDNTTPVDLTMGTPGTSFATGDMSSNIAIAPIKPSFSFNFVPKPFNSIESKNDKFKTLDPIRYFWSDGARRFFIINREKDCPNQTKLMVLPFDTIEWDIANPTQGVLFDDGLKRVRSFNWVQDIGATGIIMAGVVNGVVGLE